MHLHYELSIVATSNGDALSVVCHAMQARCCRIINTGLRLFYRKSQVALLPTAETAALIHDGVAQGDRLTFNVVYSA